MRPCQGGFLWGVYEEAPRFFDMQSLGTTFDVKDMPLDIEVLRSATSLGASSRSTERLKTDIAR
jgi:hypothetical protein